MGEGVAGIVDRILTASPEVVDAAAAADSPEVRAKVDVRLAELEAEFKSTRAAAVAYLLRDSAPEPDWPGVCGRAATFLSGVARSTRITALLVEGLVYQYAWDGLLQGLRLYRRLLEEQAERVYPAQPGARHALFVVQTRDFNLRPPLPMPIPVWNVPIVTAAGRGVGLVDVQYLDRQVRKFPDLIEVHQARAALPANARVAWLEAGRAALAEVERLRGAMTNDFERAGAQLPDDLREGLSRLEKRAGDYLGQAEDWLAAVPAPDVPPQDGAGDTPPEPPPEGVRGKPTEPPRKPELGQRAAPRSRGEALAQLAAAEEYFARTDPHSPVGYRLRTARRWMTQPVTDVLAQLLSTGEHLSAAMKGLGLDQAPGATSEGNITTENPGQAGCDLERDGESRPPTPPVERLTLSERDQAVRAIEAVMEYLRVFEPHSMAKFPLAFAIRLAKMSIEAIIEQAIVDENARDTLLKELGVPFLSKSSGVKK